MKNPLAPLLETRKEEIDALNGLRAFAIIAVLIIHAYDGLKFKLPESFVSSVGIILTNLTSGVDLFFVLSGFLISGGLYRDLSRQGRIDYLKFYIKRTFRIFPAYYFFLIVTLLFVNFQIDFLEKNIATLNPDRRTLLNVLHDRIHNFRYDFLYVSNYFGGFHAQTWSLSVEEQFYLLFPVTYFLLYRFRKNGMMSSLLVLYAVPVGFRLYYYFTGQHDVIYTFFHTRFDTLIAGILAMHIASSDHPVRRMLETGMSRKIALVVAVFLVFTAHLFTQTNAPFMYHVARYNMLNVGFATILLLSLARTSRLSKILSIKLFRPIARVSYGIYLWHFTIGLIGISTATRIAGVPESIPNFLFHLCMDFIYSFGIAAVLFLVFEHPILKAGKRLLKRDGGVPVTV